MLLLIHVLVAITGLLLSGLTAVRPSNFRLLSAWTAVGLTFLSGLGLMAVNHVQLARLCLSGLAYLAIVLPLISIGAYRLVRPKA